MKIGMVTPQDPRTGISIYAAILAAELKNLGEDVSIITPDNSSNQLPVNLDDIKIISPENYDADDYEYYAYEFLC